MSYQVNLHVPLGVDDFRTLSPENFVSITKHEGNFTTTDIYYQPTFVKKESFKSKLSGLFERLKGFKPANDSDSLNIALKNIKDSTTTNNHGIPGSQANLLPNMIHELALKQENDNQLGHEVVNNGTTFTLVNWDKEDSKNYESNLKAPKQKEKSSDNVAMSDDPDRVIGIVRIFHKS
jgi:hypothetical protein